MSRRPAIDPTPMVLHMIKKIKDLETGHRYVLCDLESGKEIPCEARYIGKDKDGVMVADLHRVFKSSGRVAETAFVSVTQEIMRHGNYIVCWEEPAGKWFFRGAEQYG